MLKDINVKINGLKIQGKIDRGVQIMVINTETAYSLIKAGVISESFIKIDRLNQRKKCPVFEVKISLQNGEIVHKK